MMGSGGWWNLKHQSEQQQQQQISPVLPSSSSTSSPSFSSFPQYPLPSVPWHDTQDLPESWSQLLLGGLVDEDMRCSSYTPFQTHANGSSSSSMVDVKQERIETGSPWNQILPVSVSSSPRSSCITNIMDFATTTTTTAKLDGHPKPDVSSECNSTSSGSALKKARRAQGGGSSAQSCFKVRKEKLGDRITSLHQLVSPFGKTDTASVLLEAIGYIRFLQSQIETLSSPYMGGSGQGEGSCIFPEDPGQLLNDACLKRRGAIIDQKKTDLKSKGLCLVPISCTMHVDNDNGADYWTPPGLGVAFR
ncbi:BHLH transcription factor-like protein [Zostera marina]|uniref:BHLH transcription factor-like protein n=1 Tax=Zostera marina TaxID=29655 RepID=A0A0K9NGJ9_ZOSMR|nr:BHLH transcription factor-like protein [Zostera marina]